MDWLTTATRDPHGPTLAWQTLSYPKGLLHTTEGSSWPDYGGWTMTPHGTALPIPGVGIQARQHIPYTQAAAGLMHTGDPETNRLGVIQWELIGTCDPSMRGQLYYWPEADDAVLADLYRKVIAPTSTALGIPLTALTFEAYPASAGADNGVRLSGPAWVTYTGWLGHQHVPENDHGDPGAFPWARMLQAAGGDMPLSDTDLANIAKTVETYFQVHVGKGLETRDQALGDEIALTQQLSAKVDALAQTVAAIAAKVGATTHP